MNTWREALLWAGGVHSLLFAAFHLLFWRLFNWREQLQKVSAVNRGVMQVLNLCLTYLFVAFGVLVILNRREILETTLGKHLLWVLCGFWALRFVEQFVFLRLRHWMSWLLTLLFLAGALIYGAVAFGS